MEEIAVDIWIDVVCPWCYIGKRQFDAALAQFEHRNAVRVRWRSFELDPDGPLDNPLTIPQRMRQDLGLSAEQAAQGLRRITSLAADLGLEYRLEGARPVNSFDAHRLLHLATARGLGEPVRERLMKAYTSEGALLSDRATLVDLAAEAGLDAAATRQALKGEDYADVVRADEKSAYRFGVTGVPTFVFSQTYRVAGAQPAGALTGLLRKSWDEARHTSKEGRT